MNTLTSTTSKLYLIRNHLAPISWQYFDRRSKCNHSNGDKCAANVLLSVQTQMTMSSNSSANTFWSETNGSQYSSRADQSSQPVKLTSASASNYNNSDDIATNYGYSNSISYRKHSQHDEYNEAIRDLNSLQSNSLVVALAKYKKPETILPLFRKQLNLAGIRVEDLNRLNVIHVTGTKGKGSTCAITENILASSDKIRLKVGCYNSPHLVNVTERIKINSKPIDKVLFSRHFRHVYDKLKYETKRENITMPSYFSFLTILAFHIFLEENIDCAIVEVGIGGEYDPTNVVEKPIACAITTLDLDHTTILGKTIESIARAKAGIIKPGVPVFTIEHEQEEAIRVIESKAREMRSPVYVCKQFDHNSNVDLAIKSHAQYVNASIACQVAAYLLARIVQDKCKVGNLLERPVANSGDKPVLLETNLQNLPDFFRTSLAQTQLPGRCQIVKCPGITFFLDGAHTRKSMNNCLDWFVRYSINADTSTKRFLLINVIGERDKSEVLRPLTKFEHFDCVMFSTNKIHSNKHEHSMSDTFARLQDQSTEKGLENAKINARVWSELVQQNLRDGTANKLATTLPEAKIHSCTMDCLKSIESSDWVMKERKDSKTGQVHVLVTGSLHFVGAILETIELLYPNVLGGRFGIRLYNYLSIPVKTLFPESNRRVKSLKLKPPFEK